MAIAIGAMPVAATGAGMGPEMPTMADSVAEVPGGSGNSSTWVWVSDRMRCRACEATFDDHKQLRTHIFNTCRITPTTPYRYRTPTIAHALRLPPLHVKTDQENSHGLNHSPAHAPVATAPTSPRTPGTASGCGKSRGKFTALSPNNHTGNSLAIEMVVNPLGLGISPTNNIKPSSAPTNRKRRRDPNSPQGQLRVPQQVLDCLDTPCKAPKDKTSGVAGSRDEGLGQGQSQCSGCQFSGSEDELFSHKVDKHNCRFVCALCGSVQMDYMKLKVHLYNTHCVEPPGDVAIEFEPTICCRYCDANVGQQEGGDMWQHMQEYHKFQYICEYCFTRFSNKKNICRHLANCHNILRTS